MHGSKLIGYSTIFQVVPDNIEADDYDLPYVRAYFLIVISTTIDGDNSEALCNLMYLKLLKDVETI